MQATGGLRVARGRWRVDVHMSSLAAKDAWREYAGSYVMVGVLGITYSKPQNSPSSVVPGPLCRV